MDNGMYKVLKRRTKGLGPDVVLAYHDDDNDRYVVVFGVSFPSRKQQQRKRSAVLEWEEIPEEEEEIEEDEDEDDEE